MCNKKICHSLWTDLVAIRWHPAREGMRFCFIHVTVRGSGRPRWSAAASQTIARGTSVQMEVYCHEENLVPVCRGHPVPFRRHISELRPISSTFSIILIDCSQKLITCFSEDALAGWVQLCLAFLKGPQATILQQTLITGSILVKKKSEWTWSGHASQRFFVFLLRNF